MGSMLRAFRRGQGTTGPGFRRWGRQDRPGAFMRAWLAAGAAFRPSAPQLVPLGRPVLAGPGPYMFSTGGPEDPATTTGGVAGDPSSRTEPQPVGAPGKWRKRLAWVLKLVSWFKRRPEFPGYDSGGGPRGV